MAVATTDDVAVALGRPISSAEEDQINYWLAGAELLIKSRLGDLALLDQDALKYVETEAIVAKVNNPAPDPGGEEKIDDYSRRWGPTPFRGVEILDAWWELLSPSAGSAAFSVRPGFEPDTDDAPTVPLNWT